MLIRYTSNKYADSYLSGQLYLSSLSRFWSLKDMRENPENTQCDYGEGIASQIPHNKFNKFKEFLPKNLADIIINDIRLRLQAYKYCNLLCFYRVDILCTDSPIFLDEDNLAYIATCKGFPITGNEIRTMAQLNILKLDRFISNNPVISPAMNAFIQLPDETMDLFGDIVIIIKNEHEFIRRVINAVKKENSECIIGDVRYHTIQDRVEPDKSGKKHSATFFIEDFTIDIDSEFIDADADIIKYGCLDKHSRFKNQKEWRVCWLPQEKNSEGKILNVGRLDDIIEIVPSTEIRQRLLEINPCHIPGIIEVNKNYISGTLTYEKFKEKVEAIDKKCSIIFDIG